MSDSLTIYHEVQPDNVGLFTDDLGLPAAVEGEGNISVLKSAARITPQNREGAEAVPPSRNVYPRRAAQFVSVRQAHRGAAHDVLIHSYAPLIRPARCSRRQSGSNRAHTPRGGNLARPQSTRTGLFSFQVQLSQYLKADLTNPTESAGVLPAADRAGAATHRLAHAESRPFPLIQINHVHAVLLSDRDRNRTSFRIGGIFVREGR